METCAGLQCRATCLYKKSCPSQSNQLFFSMVILSYPTKSLIGACDSIIYLGGTLLGELVLVCSFPFALTMVLVCHRLHDHPITFFIQPIFLVRPLISPANRIRSGGRRRRIQFYGDAAKDHDLGGNEQLPCRHMLTYGSNVGA